MIWTFTTDAPALGDPFLAEDYVVVGTTGGEILVLDQQDGDLVWSGKPDGGLQSPIAYDRFVLLWTDHASRVMRCPLDDFITATDAELPFKVTLPAQLHPTRQRTFWAGEGQVACLSGNYADVLWRHDAGNTTTTWCTVTERAVELATDTRRVTLAVDDGAVLADTASDARIVAPTRPVSLVGDKEAFAIAGTRAFYLCGSEVGCVSVDTPSSPQGV